MPITKLKKHDHCTVVIHYTDPFTCTHTAALRCKDCDVHIQWLSGPDAQYLFEQGINVSKKLVGQRISHSATPRTNTTRKKFKRSYGAI